MIQDMKQWIPEEIKSLRKRLNLYQKDFAEQLGITPRYVIYLEQGVKGPGETLKRLLNCLEEKENRKGE